MRAFAYVFPSHSLKLRNGENSIRECRRIPVLNPSTEKKILLPPLNLLRYEVSSFPAEVQFTVVPLTGLVAEVLSESTVEGGKLSSFMIVSKGIQDREIAQAVGKEREYEMFSLLEPKLGFKGVGEVFEFL